MSRAEVSISHDSDGWNDPCKWRWIVIKNGQEVYRSWALCRLTARIWAGVAARRADGIRFKGWPWVPGVVVNGALAFLWLAHAKWVSLAISLTATAAFAALIVHHQRKERHRGYRQAEGDHQDQGAGASRSAARIGSLLSLAGVPEGPSPGLDLPVRESDETIVGYKLAFLTVEGGRLWFRGIGNGNSAPYGVEASATCVVDPHGVHFMMSMAGWPGEQSCEHVPNPDHTCGFYAVPNAPDLAYYMVLLEVEIFGTVVAHEKGWRAEKQRVLSVRFPKKCASSLCAAAATLVAAVDSKVVGLCDEHAEKAESSPLCSPAPLSSLAALLGTEVRWAS